jgi:hypothetical protein
MNAVCIPLQTVAEARGLACSLLGDMTISQRVRRCLQQGEELLQGQFEFLCPPKREIWGGKWPEVEYEIEDCSGMVKDWEWGVERRWKC